MHLSILESTAVQQTTGVPAVSTVKLIDLASAAGQRIYSATAANYASAVQPNLVNCAPHLANFSSYLASGLRLILPARCDIAENSWSGAGYFTVGSGLYLGSVISDGLSGGFANRAVLKFNTAGKPETYTEPSGLQLKYTYSGNDLTQVQNSLGRTLTLVDGPRTDVSDTVSVEYDGERRPTQITDALGKQTRMPSATPGTTRGGLRAPRPGARPLATSTTPPATASAPPGPTASSRPPATTQRTGPASSRKAARPTWPATPTTAWAGAPR